MGNETGGKFLAAVSTISTLLLAWIGFVVTRSGEAAERAADAAKLALAQVAEERQRVSGQRDVNLKVYDAVASALQDSSRRRQEIARSLVYAMVTDSLLLQGLLQALRQEGVASVRQVITRDLAFDDTLRQSRVAARTLPEVRGVSRIDLFWCEASGATARQVVERARAQLVQKGFRPEGVRVRSLPASVNARPGYYVSGLEVRYETEEQSAAEQIRDAIAHAAGQPAHEVALRLIGVQTRGYVSGFACP